MNGVLKELGTSNDDIVTNFIIFCLSLGLIILLILLLVCFRRQCYAKLPSILQKQIINIGNMIRYNSVLRYLLTAYLSLFMGALVVVTLPREQRTTTTLAMSTAQLFFLLAFVFYQFLFFIKNRDELEDVTL